MSKVKETCWEYLDCEDLTRDRCIAYRIGAGNNCFSAMIDYAPCLNMKGKIDSCVECEWYKLLNLKN